jgi:hypothetical protein
MGKLAGHMKQDASGLVVPIYDGWSWPVFFVGPVWHLVKGIWGIGLLYAAVCIFSGGLGWIVGLFIMPKISNKQYREHLAEKGYRLVEPT